MFHRTFKINMKHLNENETSRIKHLKHDRKVYATSQHLYLLCNIQVKLLQYALKHLQ